METEHEHPWIARSTAQVRAGNAAEQGRRRFQQIGCQRAWRLARWLVRLQRSRRPALRRGWRRIGRRRDGLLLGNKKVRKVGGKVAIYGGLAALGVLAYKAYGNYNAQKGSAPQREPQTLDRLPPAQVEQHSQAILKALVAAAKADGHIDERERELIEGEFTKLDNDQELQHWLHTELNKPLDPTDVARAASTPEMAAEMYIASVMLVDEENFMEKSYLDELARQLKLEPGLKVELERQVRLAAD